MGDVSTFEKIAEYAVGPKIGELISLGGRRVIGKGANMAILIPLQVSRSYGIEQCEVFEVFIKRTGIKLAKQNRPGNPFMKRKKDD